MSRLQREGSSINARFIELELAVHAKTETMLRGFMNSPNQHRLSQAVPSRRPRHDFIIITKPIEHDLGKTSVPCLHDFGCPSGYRKKSRNKVNGDRLRLKRTTRIGPADSPAADRDETR
jgi:hypothetical protein